MGLRFWKPNEMPKGKESVQNAPPNCNNKSQQSLYLKEILTKLLKEEWEGFNS